MSNNKILMTALLAISLFLYPIVPLQAQAGKGQGADIPYQEIKQSQVNSEELSAAQKISLDVVSSIDQTAVDTTAPKQKPKYWKSGILTQISLSQVSLTNWAAGGQANISMNGLVDANANYSKDKMIWENRLKLSYGFVQSFEHGVSLQEQFKKSDDKILLNSKWGYLVYDRLYVSALFSFRSQITPTNDYVEGVKTLKSRFMAPGYLSIGLGINYKPFQCLSINLSPITGNFVVVTEENLRETYGNKIDQPVRTEIGAQLKFDFDYSYKTFKIGSDLILFSDYLNNPQNIQVSWDVDASLALSKFFTLTLRTSLMYDHNIKIADANGNNAQPRIQFKEIVGIGFTYTFGHYIKGE